MKFNLLLVIFFVRSKTLNFIIYLCFKKWIRFSWTLFKLLIIISACLFVTLHKIPSNKLRKYFNIILIILMFLLIGWINFLISLSLKQLLFHGSLKPLYYRYSFYFFWIFSYMNRPRSCNTWSSNIANLGFLLCRYLNVTVGIYQRFSNSGTQKTSQ